MCIIALGSKPKGPIIGMWMDGIAGCRTASWDARERHMLYRLESRNKTGRNKGDMERVFE